MLSLQVVILTQYYPLTLPMTAQLTWLKYNWKWALPMIALGIFVPVTSCIFVTIILISYLAVRTSTIYKQAMVAVRSDDRIIELIGSPIQPGLFVLGTISRRPAGTMVNLTIPLYGPGGKATAFAVSTKTEGNWNFTTLQVQVKSRQAYIDLLKDILKE